ncbi:hypothetical protein AX16_002668 [Volvariella volvacea WC 439]|nr:hypothetical protein AX16_002668 [Volvariella volvacea WC 439]
MASATTPLTPNAQYIQADDDDDFDEDNIPGFSHPAMSQHPQPVDKGKGRAQESNQLAPPAGSSSSSSAPLSGNIGSSPSGAARPARQTFGGVQVETR